MPKFIVEVTMYFQIALEAEDSTMAELEVRGMDDAELFSNNVCDYLNHYEVIPLDDDDEPIYTVA